jgi:hypothetical protein
MVMTDLATYESSYDEAHAQQLAWVTANPVRQWHKIPYEQSQKTPL